MKSQPAAFQDAVLVHKFCPLAGRPRETATTTKADLCTADSCTIGQPSLSRCPNALRGQNVRVGTTNNLPGIIAPALSGGRPWAGYYIRTHQALGKALGYEPELVFHQAGVFNHRKKASAKSYRELVPLSFVPKY